YRCVDDHQGYRVIEAVAAAARAAGALLAVGCVVDDVAGEAARVGQTVEAAFARGVRERDRDARADRRRSAARCLTVGDRRGRRGLIGVQRERTAARDEDAEPGVRLRARV